MPDFSWEMWPIALLAWAIALPPVLVVLYRYWRDHDA